MFSQKRYQFPHSSIFHREVSLKIIFTMVWFLTLPSLVLAERESDPWEGYNRWMFQSNDDFDRLLVRPVAKIYDTAVPDLARVGVNNFFNNFYDFNGAVNAFLQGRLNEAMNNSLRVLVNSTVGVFGLFDVATAEAIPRYETNFGHTLFVWGAPRGNYIVLPFLGPSTLRSATGMTVDAFAAPTAQIFDETVYWGLRSLNILDLRAGLLDAEELVTGDRYLFYRDVYLQTLTASESDGGMTDEFSDFDDGWDGDEF